MRIYQSRIANPDVYGELLMDRMCWSVVEVLRSTALSIPIDC